LPEAADTVKAKPVRAASRALTALALLPAIKYFGRGTRMPSGGGFQTRMLNKQKP